ncbi:MAG: thiol:disulfide interchange protein DsbA/DsbL [Candidatus Competibacteraceae bacterium]
MKTIRPFILVALLLLGLPPVAPAADDFQAGKDYKVLDRPVPTSTGDKIEVVEAFSYACPHCFSLEPSTEEWLKAKPENVELVRIPAVWRPDWEVLARAYYAAVQLGVLDKVNKPLFDAIHIDKKPLTTPEQLADFFAAQGVDKTAFLNAYNSFGVETRVQRAKQLIQRYVVMGVPAFIVNGKYFVDLSTAGSAPRLFEVINYLVAKETTKG